MERDLDPNAVELLRQSYHNNWQRYVATLTASAPGAGAWDECVTVVHSTYEAEQCMAHLDALKAAGRLAAATRFRAIAEADGGPGGSGGVVLRVLRRLAREATADDDQATKRGAHPLAGKRIQIILAGGDPQQLPRLLPRHDLLALSRQVGAGEASTCLEEILASVTGLADRAPEGVLIVSAGALVLCDRAQLSLDGADITGMAVGASPEEGRRGDVYVTMGPLRQVVQLLHRPSVHRLRQEYAIGDDGQVQASAGWVWFGATAVARLVTLSQQVCEGASPDVDISLNGDLLAPLAQEVEYTSYIASSHGVPATPALGKTRKLIWNALRGTSFRVVKLQPAMLISLGGVEARASALGTGRTEMGGCGRCVPEHSAEGSG